VLYLAQAGLSEQEIGLLLSLTLAGDAVITLWITTSADRIVRKRMLILGAALMILAGIVFVLTKNLALLIFTAIIGVISPSGNEIGLFLSIEQAVLFQLIPDERRTKKFVWYNLVGSFATALGALCSGGLAQALQNAGIVRWFLSGCVSRLCRHGCATHPAVCMAISCRRSEEGSCWGAVAGAR